MRDILVSEYIALQPESFRGQRRHYVLAKVLQLFLRYSGFGSVENAVRFYAENPRNGLAIALQKVINALEGRGS